MTAVAPLAAVPVLATAALCKAPEPLAALPFQQMLQAEVMPPAISETETADVPDALAIDWAGLMQSFSTVAIPAEANAPRAVPEPAATTPDAVGLPLALPEPSLRWLDVLKEIEHSLPSRHSADTGLALASLPATAPVPAPQVLVDVQTAALPPDFSTLSAAPSPLPPVASLMPPPLVSNPVVAPPPVPAAPPLVMDSPDWPQQLGEQIQWRLGVGIQEARIEISPRELGAVDVRLSVDDKGLSVHLTAAHAQTRELLQSELPRLREVLQQGGVLLADAQVGRESPGREAPRQTTPNNSRSKPGDDADGAVASTLPSSWRRRNGLLDDYA
ncbi:MAG: flagellar hook-length control protein FliK [Stagnimonas sp.]|nr:flagellar hook-length control protein FliK [Stagnimonas sp.]